MLLTFLHVNIFKCFHWANSHSFDQQDNRNKIIRRSKRIRYNPSDTEPASRTFQIPLENIRFYTVMCPADTCDVQKRNARTFVSVLVEHD